MLTKVKKLIRNNYFIGFLTFLISFIIYLKTLCPTVYWGDSGELITAAYTLGIAHPSGYPTYVLLGKLFTFIPFGSIAWRINLMSAFFASLSVLLLYFICFKLTKSKLVSFATSLIFAFSYTFWSQAVIAEVYTFHIFFLTLNLFILLHWKEKQKQQQQNHIHQEEHQELLYHQHNQKYNYNRWLYLFCFTYGLSLTNHITSVLFFPAFAYFILVKEHQSLFNIKWNKNFLKFKTIIICLLLFIFGLLPYAYIPIRSSMDPVWDWGDINTNPQKLFWHISGGDYHQFMSYSSFFNNFKNFILSLYQEFNIVFILMGLFGVYLFYKNSKIKENFVSFNFLILLMIINLIYSLNYQIGDINNYFIPFFIIFSLLVCFLLSEVYYFIRKLIINKALNKSLSLGSFLFITLILLLLLLFPFFKNFQQNDLSEDFSAFNYWSNIFESTNANDIIVGKGTDDLFIPLFFQNVERKYQDRIVINLHELTKPWRFKKIQKILHIKANNTVSVYKNSREAELVAETNVNILFDTYLNKTNIYITFRNLTTDYYLLPYGHLYQISRKSKKLNFPEMKYPYGDVHDLDGKNYVSNILIFYGLYFIEKEEFNVAVDYFKKAINIKSDSFDAWNDLAIAYYHLKNYEGAISAWEKALEIKEDPIIKKNVLAVKNKLNN